MTHTTKTKVDAATKRKLAVEASCDPRTLDKALLGQLVRGLARHRIDAALKAAGIALPPPKEIAVSAELPETA